MSLFHLQLLTTGLILAGPVALVQTADGHLRREARVMGTVVTVELEAGDRSAALAASEVALRAIEETESRFSSWRPESELSRLVNAAPKVAQVLSPELGSALQRAFHWSRESGGAFDPSIAPLVRAWDLRGTGRRPSPVELDAALAQCGLEHFRDELPARLTRLVSGAGIEEGGFGKGLALDAAAHALQQLGIASATLDLGGQVLVLSSATPRSFQIADPDQRQRGALQLTITRGSFATSGNSERGLQVDGERIGHLLDPRTGQPARDFGSVTVWCANGLDADCLSTALYVLGPERGLQFAADHDNVEAVYLVRSESGVRVRATRGLRQQLTTLDGQQTIEWYPTSSPPPSPGDPSRKGSL